MIKLGPINGIMEGEMLGKDSVSRWLTGPLYVAALFDAVEQQDLDAVKVILDSNSVDINRYSFILLPQLLQSSRHFLFSCSFVENRIFLCKGCRMPIRWTDVRAVWVLIFFLYIFCCCFSCSNIVRQGNVFSNVCVGYTSISLMQALQGKGLFVLCHHQ